ncbi:hypothetical protein TSAR_015463, partial [Trichomalopsis sarcophagae]
MQSEETGAYTSAPRSYIRMLGAKQPAKVDRGSALVAFFLTMSNSRAGLNLSGVGCDKSFRSVKHSSHFKNDDLNFEEGSSDNKHEAVFVVD